MLEAYNVKTKRMDKIHKITGMKPTKNGAMVVMGMNSQGDKLAKIVSKDMAKTLK